MEIDPYFLLHWIHVLGSVIWIGTLYFFNFFLNPFLEKTRADARVEVFHNLVPLTLGGFNWGTVATVLSGWLIYLHRITSLGSAVFFNWPYGLAISVGGLLGTVMFLNGWFVMHPKQVVVIASATQIAQGGQPIPEAAAYGRTVVITSRTNLLLSIPMIFLMVAATHDPAMTVMTPQPAPVWFWMVVLAVIGAIEINALAVKPGPAKRPLETITGALAGGFVLLAAFYMLIRMAL